MILTLVAVSLNEQALSQPITAVFDARGGTIGRADHNTMALPDPQRHVSRLQAEVVAQGDNYLLRNVGQANPIVVGARSLASGEAAPLAHDDAVRIGPYLLKVQLSAAAPVVDSATLPRTPVTAHDPFADLPASAPAPLAANAFGDLLGSSAAVSSDNPFADLLGAAPAPQAAPLKASAPADPFADLMPPPSGVDARSAAVAAKPPPRPQLPDDFDPFAAPPPKPAPLAPAGNDPFADLMGPGSTPSIDAMFNLGGSSDADPLAAFVGSANAAAAPSATATAASADPLAMFAPAAPPPSMVQPPQRDDVSALHDAWQPPRARTAVDEAKIEATPPPPAPPSRTPRLDEQAAMWAAFCQGAGIDVPLPAGGAEQRMQALGRILRSAIEGTLQLIAVRASTKHELRAGVTVIQQRNNNPLKFSPDAKAGLEQLLQPPLRGFLDGPAAMDDAMHDLVGHSIGTVAGLRAAVEGMLERFEPSALESKLVGRSVLDSLLPGSRKARLWELYLQHHEAIRAEAQEDFHTLFGKAFLAAYEQQIERLRHDSKKAVR